MDEIATLLARAYQPANQAELNQIRERFESWGANPDVMGCLLQILASDKYPEPVRVQACVLVRLAATNHWNDESAAPFRGLLIEKTPEIVVSAPLFLKASANYLAEVVVELVDLSEWQSLPGKIIELAKGDEPHFGAAVVLYGSLVKKLKQGEVLVGLTEAFLGEVERVFCETGSLSVRAQCLSVLQPAMAVSKGAVYGKAEIWCKSVEIMAAGCSLNEETLRFVEATIWLYVHAPEPLPGIDRLLSMVLQLLPRDWGCNKAEFVGLGVRLLSFASRVPALFEVLKQNVAGLVQESILPLFVLSDELIGMADSEPTQFMLDIPMTPADLGRVFEAPEFSAYLLQFVMDSIMQFSKDNNAASLFSRMLLACCGWSRCYKLHREAIDSMYVECSGLLLGNPSTLAQTSFLMLMESEYTIENVTNPEHLVVAVQGLRSDKGLVRYFAINVIKSVLHGLTLTVGSWASRQHDLETLETLRLQYLDRARSILTTDVLVLILDCAATISHDYGCPDLLMIFSMVLKDPVMMSNVASDPPRIVSQLMELACTYAAREMPLGSLFDAILNMLRELEKEPTVEVVVCKQIFASIMTNFDLLASNETNLEPLARLFSGLVYYCPQHFPEFWQPIERLLSLCVAADDMSIGPFSALMHNLMLKDPDTVRRDIAKFVQIGTALLQLDQSMACDVLINYNSALFSVAVPGSIPTEYIQHVCAQLQDVPTDTIIGSIKQMSYMVMALARYSPELIQVIMNTYLEWAEYVDGLELAYTISLLWGHLPQELIMNLLGNVFSQGCLKNLMVKEEDYDEKCYEDEFCTVETQVTPIISIEQEALAIREFLQMHNAELGPNFPVQQFLAE